MRHCVCQIEEECWRLVLLDEREGACRVALRQIRLHDRIFQPPISFDELDRPHVIGVGNSQILGEATMRRQPLLLRVTEVPLAHDAGRITGLLKELREGDLAFGKMQPVRLRSAIGSAGFATSPQRRIPGRSINDAASARKTARGN